MGKRTPPWPPYPEWSTARWWSFLRSGLRRMSTRWGPKYETMNDARRPNESSNKRMKWEYQCAECEHWFPQKEVSVDHIVPVGTLKCYEDLPAFVEGLFCGKAGLQVLCKGCHDAKTQIERSN